MSENVFWLSMWAMILAAAVTLTTLLQYNYCNHVQRMVEHGYQEEMVVGSHTPVWRKVAEPVRPAVLDLPMVAGPEAQIAPL